MLTVDQALELIEASVRPAAPVSAPLHAARGLTLEADIVSDIDSPPFDKALMDGFAVRSGDVQGPADCLRIVGELTAGHVSDRVLAGGETVRIMTGAPIPSGADAVIRVEDAVVDGDSVRFPGGAVAAGKNVLHKGTAMRSGEVVIPAGRMLRAPELGLLAELGRACVSVIPSPSVALLATGDELVPVAQSPGAGQIRNSNETMLQAQLSRMGCDVAPLGIARDDATELAERIRKGLEHDVLCLSGGVSMGKLDLVPAALASCGVGEVFHKVYLKPGKPIWYGILDAEDGRRRHIFGLPGNPVSSMVCCELFVQTAVRLLSGRTPGRATPVPSKLAVAHTHRDERPTFLPARCEATVDGPLVSPIGWKGSADLRSTVEANCMAFFPAGVREYAAGDVVDVYSW